MSKNPLDILFVGTVTHHHHGWERAIFQYFTEFDSVRSVTASYSLNMAKRRLATGAINTVIILDANYESRWKTSSLIDFISATRVSRPNVFFIYCGPKRAYEYTLEKFSRLEHYTKIVYDDTYFTIY